MDITKIDPALGRVMKPIKLIYFKGCPNADKAKEILKAFGEPFEEICQDALPQDDPSRAYSSPTILKGDEVILGAAIEGERGGCSIEALDEKAIISRLRSV